MCSWKSEHGFWPEHHHPRAIALAALAARYLRNAELILERMQAHQCLICGAALKPALAKD